MQEVRDREDHILRIMEANLAFQEKLLVQIQKILKRMPEGTVCKKVIKGHTYYYLNEKDKNGKQVQRILKKNESDLIQELLRKYCLKKCIRNIKNNIPLLEKFIKQYLPLTAEIDNEKISLMLDLMLDKTEIIERWINEPFKSNPSFESNARYATLLGKNVRSKSEVIIVNMLESNKIPFRYEAELRLGKDFYYPDFTILCPKSGKIIFWEHFGMMNDINYRQKVDKKLKVYFENDILPFKNLITTYDKPDGTLDIKVIQNLIEFIHNS